MSVLPPDDEVLARVFRRFLEDTADRNFVDVDPDDYPDSGTIDGELHLRPGEAEVIYRVRQLACQRADLGPPGDFKPESYRISFNDDGTVETTLTGTSEAPE